jgi:hypothetical protein
MRPFLASSMISSIVDRKLLWSRSPVLISLISRAPLATPQNAALRMGAIVIIFLGHQPWP